MSKYIVDIHGDIEGDYEIIKKYEEPKARWIPVSERLPEKDGEYLVTIRWRNNYAVDNYSVVKRKYYADVKTWDDSLVIAYVPQPLPQPYKAESEEEE